MNNQEVPQGYKETKVGVIPLEWEVVKLDEVAKFYKGKGISKAEISDEGIECIRYGELYTKYNEKIEHIISKTITSKDKLFLSEVNDILIPASGETAIDLATASCVLKRDVGLGGDINVIRSKLDGIFLSYYLNVISKTKIASLAQGISVIHLYSSQLKNLYISKPPLKEQQKIAKILTTWDDSISKQEELIKAKEQLKKGLMQKLLSGAVRFDGFSEEWEEVRLGDISKFQQGLQVDVKNQTTKYNKDYKRFIRIVDYTQINEEPRYIKYENNYINKYVNTNEIVMIRYGNIGYIGRNIEGVIANNMFKINFISKVNLDYIFYVLNSDKVQHFLQSNNTSSTMPALSFGIVKRLEIKLPLLQEQQKIAQVLSTADKEIELLKNELESLKEQKKGLMQKLLTGEVRVEV